LECKGGDGVSTRVEEEEEAEEEEEEEEEEQEEGEGAEEEEVRHDLPSKTLEEVVRKKFRSEQPA